MLTLWLSTATRAGRAYLDQSSMYETVKEDPPARSTKPTDAWTAA